jgi:hypothetical protein
MVAVTASRASCTLDKRARNPVRAYRRAGIAEYWLVWRRRVGPGMDHIAVATPAPTKAAASEPRSSTPAPFGVYASFSYTYHAGTACCRRQASGEASRAPSMTPTDVSPRAVVGRLAAPHPR